MYLQMILSLLLQAVSLRPGIGIIRISGPDAIDVADKIFLTGSRKKDFFLPYSIPFIMVIFYRKSNLKKQMKFWFL